MKTIFWLTLATILYIYVGYPAVLAWVRVTRARNVRKKKFEPNVTIIIAAYNERERIGPKLQNCLDLEYPPKKLQILVSLDGPTDGTEFVVWKFAQHGVQMVHSRQHRGKPAALNRGIERASGDIVVFADSRQMFDRNAIRRLVENFADPDVGAVSGELVLLDENSGEATTDIGLYWRYEKWIRTMESDLHSVVGATGAIYAIRRGLYQELPDDTLLDDVLTPMRIVLGGKRVVFEPDAKAFDNVACCPKAEFGRKVRTLAGNYQLLTQLPRLLSPRSNPVFWQFTSHKLGRLAVPHLLLAMFVSNALTLGGVYSWLFLCQCAWYLCALIGYVIARRNMTEPSMIAEHERKAA